MKKTSLLMATFAIIVIGTTAQEQLTSRLAKTSSTYGIKTTSLGLNPLFEDNKSDNLLIYDAGLNNSKSALLKSNSSTKYLVDSLYYYTTIPENNLTKQVNAYDSNGNRVEEMYSERNADSISWTESYKYTRSYDSKGNQTEIVTYEWDTLSGVWIMNGKYTYVYDSNDNLIEETNLIWDANILSTGSNKHSFIYDSNNKIIGYSSYTWSPDSNCWTPLSKYTVTYNPAEDQYEYEVSRWNPGFNTWSTTEKFITTYNSNDKLIAESHYQWVDSSDIWEEQLKDTLSYDSEGNLIDKTELSWNSDSKCLIQSSKYTYSFDSDGNKTEYAYYKWDISSSKWGQYERLTYNYDSTGNCSTSYYWNGIDTNWCSMTKYFYSSHAVTTTAAENISSDDMQLYPNPASSIVTITTGEQAHVEMFNISGKLVKTETSTGMLEIQLDDLARGLYLVKISSSTGTCVKKLLVK